VKPNAFGHVVTNKAERAARSQFDSSPDLIVGGEKGKKPQQLEQWQQARTLVASALERRVHFGHSLKTAHQTVSQRCDSGNAKFSRSSFKQQDDVEGADKLSESIDEPWSWA
jgi:hypothetical protein